MTGELVSFGIQKLWDLLSQEYERFQGVRDHVTTLKRDLNLLKSFLKDADAKKHRRDVVKICIEEIKEIIFDAEDVIETFILKDQLRKNGGIKKRIRRFTCIIPERREISLEIGSLSERITKVVCKMKDFGVQEQIIPDVSDPQPSHSQQRQEFPRKYESNLVGLEANVEKLVGYLVDGDDVQVVSVTGMGGLGKTTLARQAFNHDKVKMKFDRLAWVCVSQVCNRKNVWQTILENLKPKEGGNEIMQMTEITLQRVLLQLLETSNSLIVIDDIWQKEHWELIKPIFAHTKGSKVLLTSRNEGVVGCGEKYINFKPEYLSDQDSWTLFQMITTPIIDVSELNNVDKEMEEMGKKMIKHCRGLPLAVRVLGGLLAEKYTPRDWNRISKNIGSHLLDNTSSLNRILSLSFEELPGHLKCCFLYLAHFPEDFEIEVENLSYLWAADGILRYHNGVSIRDVGDSYIWELVRRNMVISEIDNTTSRFETCCLHDMMRDLSLTIAKEEKFFQLISAGTHPQSLSSRRFVSHYPTALDVEGEINNTKVRSLMVFSKWLWYTRWNLSSLSFTRLKQLRVLHVPGAKLKGRDLPDIGKLMHVRYLNLKYAEVSDLPSSLRNLKLLIYLNLNVHGSRASMSSFLKGMKELRYLALPRNMPKKKKLELSHLVKLEILKNFSTEYCNLKDLRGMAVLKNLEIIITGETSLETLSTAIGGLENLEHLDVEYKGDKGTQKWRTLLDFSNLKKLRLHISSPLISDDLQFPSRITVLALTGCFLEVDPMPILEKLNQLKEVAFWPHSFNGRRLVCSGSGFHQLQKLELCGLLKWEEWIVEEGSMPLLHTLTIQGCPNLKELPDGLQFITSLKNLTLHGMGVQWKKRLSEGGEDYYKVQHIPSVKI